MRKINKDKKLIIVKINNNIMEKSHELFRSFITDIIKVFPEYEERLHETYEDLFLENQENTKK